MVGVRWSKLRVQLLKHLIECGGLEVLGLREKPIDWSIDTQRRWRRPSLQPNLRADLASRRLRFRGSSRPESMFPSTPAGKIRTPTSTIPFGEPSESVASNDQPIELVPISIPRIMPGTPSVSSLNFGDRLTWGHSISYNFESVIERLSSPTIVRNAPARLCPRATPRPSQWGSF